MPTPFTHLRLVNPLVQNPERWFDAAVAEALVENAGAFLLGSTAPDVRNINSLPRKETHFYPLPPDPQRPVIQLMLEQWPELAESGRLSPARAAFVAGYLAHLWLDEFWHGRIIWPYYMERDDWGKKRQRFNVYNILLGYLDFRDRAELDPQVGPTLQCAEPAAWLPFVPDPDLAAWRDFLTEQLRPGAATHTVEIMARRAHLTPAEFEALIFNEERMDSEVFVHTPRTAVDQAYLDGLEGSVQIIRQYLALRPGQ